MLREMTLNILTSLNLRPTWTKMTKLRETTTITGIPMEKIAITTERETVARTTAPVAMEIANAEIVTTTIVITTGTEATGTEVAVETKVRALLSMTILT